MENPSPATPSPVGNLPPARLVNNMSWDAEAKAEPEVEYDVEVEPPEPEKEGSMMVTGIVVGGLVVAGTLSYVVYRGLAAN